MTWSLEMEFEGLPPSSNEAYFDKIVKKGKKLSVVRVLTTKGRAYHRTITSAIAQRYGLQLLGVRRDRPYTFILGIFTPDLFTKGWPNKAEHPYKRLDGTNRFKLLEDAVARALAIDDSQFMQNTVIKRYAEREHTKVWIWENTDDHYRHPSENEPHGGVPTLPAPGHPVLPK